MAFIKKLHFVGALCLTVLALLLRTDADISKFSVVQSAVLEFDHRDLFHFVAHPDTVERWFNWISHFRSADMRPLGIGKKYQATYTRPVIGDYVMLFNVTDFHPDTLMVLESESILKPKFEVISKPLGVLQTHLTFKVSFQRRSLLFQYTIGSVLRIFANYHLTNSLALLSQM